MSANTTYECGYIYCDESRKWAEEILWRQYDNMLIKKYEGEQQ